MPLVSDPSTFTRADAAGGTSHFTRGERQKERPAPGSAAAGTSSKLGATLAPRRSPSRARRERQHFLDGARRRGLRGGAHGPTAPRSRWRSGEVRFGARRLPEPAGPAGCSAADGSHAGATLTSRPARLACQLRCARRFFTHSSSPPTPGRRAEGAGGRARTQRRALSSSVAPAAAQRPDCSPRSARLRRDVGARLAH